MRQELADFLDYCRVERRSRAADVFRPTNETSAPASPPSSSRESHDYEVRPCTCGGFSPTRRRGGRRRRAKRVLSQPSSASFASYSRTSRAKATQRSCCAARKARDPAGYARPPRFGRLLNAAERHDVWKRKHDGKRERDRLLLALSSPTQGCAAASYSGSIGTTSTSSALCCKSEGRKAGANESCRSIPRSKSSSSTTSKSAWRSQASAVRRRTGQATLADDPDANFSPLCRRRRRDRTEARHTAHAPARIRLGTPPPTRTPPDPGATWPQAHRGEAAPLRNSGSLATPFRQSISPFIRDPDPHALLSTLVLAVLSR